MDLYIFRHGETYHTKTNTKYGEDVYKAEILPEAFPVTKRLAKYLEKINPDINFSSPYLRCRQTVEIISKVSGEDFIFDNRLSEYIVELETFTNFEARIKSFIDELYSKNLKNVAVCSHGYPIAALTEYAQSGKITEENLPNYPPPGVLRFIKGKNLQSVSFRK